jgi:hypothetical protein
MEKLCVLKGDKLPTRTSPVITTAHLYIPGLVICQDLLLAKKHPGLCCTMSQQRLKGAMPDFPTLKLSGH